MGRGFGFDFWGIGGGEDKDERNGRDDGRNVRDESKRRVTGV